MYSSSYIHRVKYEQEETIRDLETDLNILFCNIHTHQYNTPHGFRKNNDARYMNTFQWRHVGDKVTGEHLT
jgi:hypothetical protein